MITQWAHKVIGYFLYSTRGNVLCDGDACIIADTEERINFYKMNMKLSDKTLDIVRKTRFGEIIAGLEAGGAYALDREAYVRFFPLAKQYGLDELPEPDNFFSQEPASGMHFIRIQVAGGG